MARLKSCHKLKRPPTANTRSTDEARAARIELTTSMYEIRKFREPDWQSLWPMLRATFDAGDTYTFPPRCTEAEIHKAWVEIPAATFVACDAAGTILGTYFIKPNQTGHGDHVCNCGYVVAPQSQGHGIATSMCEHSQRIAVELGFRAMQFNFVVATNERAVRLWERLGFAVVGRLPGAFRHPRRGLVDALVMFKTLVPASVVYDPPP
jgi:ribosomal protein S18 acetylase RimI-like enzyme